MPKSPRSKSKLKKLPPYDVVDPKRARKAPSWHKDFETNLAGAVTPIKPSPKKTSEHYFFKDTRRDSIKKAPLGKKKSSVKPVDARGMIASLGITDMLAANYRPSIKDRYELFSVKPVHILQTINGYGLFAKENIESGVCIGEYTGNEYPMNYFHELLSENKTSSDYALKVGNKIIDAEVIGNFSRYINYSDSQANVEFRLSTINNEKRVMVVTTEPIDSGLQLLINYNTYDERVSKDYLFLNPQDNWQSTTELYAQHSHNYLRMTCLSDLDFLGVKKDEVLYLTSLGQQVIENKLLGKLPHRFDTQVNLPYLICKDGEILDATETDLYTPLMVACYLGQVKNVGWLIKHGAHINQQQNKSGNCPLFFALEGYRITGNRKSNYVDILKLLLRSKANIKTHDRDDKTFVHKAITILTAAELKIVMRYILLSMQENIATLYNYIDNTDNDIIMHCLSHCLFEKAAILLSFYPNYFNEHFVGGVKHERKFNNERLADIIKSYSQDEYAAFLVFLEHLNIALDEDLMPRPLNATPAFYT